MGLEPVGLGRVVPAGEPLNAPTITAGGPLAIACLFCESRAGVSCRRTGRGAGDPCPPHAARLKAAPPEQTITIGDLVLVTTRGQHVAWITGIGEALRVRLWLPGRQAFASERKLPREALVSLAPEGARTAIAREGQRLEQGAAGPSTEGGQSVSDPPAIHVAGLPDLWSQSTTERGHDEPARKGW